jgi:hypothetical protein
MPIFVVPSLWLLVELRVLLALHLTPCSYRAFVLACVATRQALAKYAFGLGVLQMVLCTAAFTLFSLPVGQGIGTQVSCAWTRNSGALNAPHGLACRSSHVHVHSRAMPHRPGHAMSQGWSATDTGAGVPRAAGAGGHPQRG